MQLERINSFYSFYFLVLKFILPILAACLKIRKKIINSMLLVSTSLNDNSSRKSYAKNLQKFLKTHKLFLELCKKKSNACRKVKKCTFEKKSFWPI
jgi:hypothetical protein